MLRSPPLRRRRRPWSGRRDGSASSPRGRRRRAWPRRLEGSDMPRRAGRPRRRRGPRERGPAFSRERGRWRCGWGGRTVSTSPPARRPTSAPAAAGRPASLRRLSPVLLAGTVSPSSALRPLSLRHLRPRPRWAVGNGSFPPTDDRFRTGKQACPASPDGRRGITPLATSCSRRPYSHRPQETILLTCGSP